MIGRLHFLAGIATLGASLATAPSVAASCVEPPPIQEHLGSADAIFVGTVRQVTNENRTASVEVHEVWSGPDLPAAVVVYGGPGDVGVMSSVDRFFEAGARYLFAVSLHSERLEDNACSATQRWTAELAELAPEEPRMPIPTPSDVAGTLPVPLLVALAAVAVVGVVGALAFRHRM